MEVPATFPFTRLPIDVGRVVFEAVVNDSPSNTAYALISKQVQTWVERVVYRDIALSTRRKGDLFFRTVRDISQGMSTKPLKFLDSRVKSLFIKHTIDPAVILPILEACKSIRSLACYIPDTWATPELSTLFTSPGLSSLTKLSIPISLLPPGERNFNHPLFQSLIHLEILWEEEEEAPEWSTLQGLDNLTYICLDIQFNGSLVDIVRNVACFCPRNLRVFVLSLCHIASETEDEPELKAIHAGEIDPRAVVVFSHDDSLQSSFPFTEDHAIFGVTYADFEKLWLSYWPTPPSINVWTLAEQRIEKREAKVSKDPKAPDSLDTPGSH